MKAETHEPETSFDESRDFIHGKDYSHLGGEIVSFNDASWCIVPTKGNRVSVNFRDLPQWLIRAAKLTIAWCWLTEGGSASWIAGGMCAFRRIVEWLGDFSGTSMADLSQEHFVLLQRQLATEYTRHQDAMEQAALKLGRRLSVREAKEISRASHLLGPKGISTVVSMFNLAAALTEQIDGLVVPFRLQNPRAIRQDNASRGIGSADPQKVLSAQQLADLERVLGRELRRYEKARALLQRELGQLSLPHPIEHSPVFDLERYFGINGHREHTAREISLLRGLSGYRSWIPDRIRRFLSAKIGAERAAELVALRGQFPKLRAQKKLEKVRVSREYILGVLSKSDLSVIDRKVICFERYFGLNGNRVHSQSAIEKQLGPNNHPVYFHIHSAVVSLVGERKAKRLLAIRKRLHWYLSSAIKAQAVRLQIGAARRVNAILEIPVQPRMKVHTVETRRIVEIEFHAGKTWGDEGIFEWVPCIDRFGEIAEDAIRVAQALTEDLREVAPSAVRERLFIVPKRSYESVGPLSAKELHPYIYDKSKQKSRESGLLHRYSLTNLSNFEFHHLRHTHSTHMIEAGGTIQDVAQYLGHMTIGGSATMAGTFYLAGGTDKMRERTANALRSGAATGLLFDGIARLKIESMGDEAKKAPVPPNQLSFEQARHRILSADIIEEIPIEPAEAAKLLNQKVVFNVTQAGGCLLQATSGHCPTSNPCAIGILPKGAEPSLGCGCKYLVILPHSAENLASDIAIMEAQLAEMVGEEWAGWRSHIEAKREHYRSLLEVAMSLNGPCEKPN
jgi:hypothetical protein